MYQNTWQSIQWLMGYLTQDHKYLYKIVCQIQPVVVEKFHWISGKFDQRKTEWITKVIQIHLLSVVDICTQFHGNPSNSYRDISVWTKVAE